MYIQPIVIGKHVMCGKHLPSLSLIVMVVTPLTLSICTLGLVVDRVITKTSSASITESSLVAMVIVSSVLPGLKFNSVDESTSKSASLAVASETVALNKMRK